MINQPAVLLLDNDEWVTEVMGDFIEESFPEVKYLKAHNSAEAEEAFQVWRGALAIVFIEDHFDGNGAGMVNWFRQHGYFHTLVAFFDTFERMKEMIGAGCNEILSKPFETDELLKVIQYSLWKLERSHQYGLYAL